MSSAGDTRAQERDRLKLALVTFALQLDAFEMQTRRVVWTTSQTRDKFDRDKFGRPLSRKEA
jgi:hypothetical protein